VANFTLSQSGQLAPRDSHFENNFLTKCNLGILKITAKKQNNFFDINLPAVKFAYGQIRLRSNVIRLLKGGL